MSLNPSLYGAMSKRTKLRLGILLIAGSTEKNNVSVGKVVRVCMLHKIDERTTGRNNSRNRHVTMATVLESRKPRCQAASQDKLHTPWVIDVLRDKHSVAAMFEHRNGMQFGKNSFDNRHGSAWKKVCKSIGHCQDAHTNVLVIGCVPSERRTNEPMKPRRDYWQWSIFAKDGSFFSDAEGEEDNSKHKDILAIQTANSVVESKTVEQYIPMVARFPQKEKQRHWTPPGLEKHKVGV